MIGIRADESYNRSDLCIPPKKECTLAHSGVSRGRLRTVLAGLRGWALPTQCVNGGLTGFADYLLNIFVRNPRKKPPQLFRQIQCHRDFCE